MGRGWKGRCQTGADQLISGQASISSMLGGENTFRGKIFGFSLFVYPPIPEYHVQSPPLGPICFPLSSQSANQASDQASQMHLTLISDAFLRIRSVTRMSIHQFTHG